MNWLETAFGLIYPHNCAFCKRPLPEETRDWICASCLSSVRPIVPPCCKRCGAPFEGEFSNEFTCSHCDEITFYFETAVSACRGTGIVRECIHRFKYQRQLFLDWHLSAWLADVAASRVPWSTVDWIVPVPLFPRREREREFNQAGILAQQLGKKCDKPVCSGNLRRIRDTRSQTRLDREERQRNVRDAFIVKNPAQFDGSKVALVDDVFTTGATTSECARVLKQAGAEEVFVLTVARG